MSAAAYENSVFINCPFDTEYWPLFEAITFSVYRISSASSPGTWRRNWLHARRIWQAADRAGSRARHRLAVIVLARWRSVQAASHHHPSLLRGIRGCAGGGFRWESRACGEGQQAQQGKAFHGDFSGVEG